MRFERGRKINESLQIGVFSPKEFNNDFEAVKYIFDNLEIIFGDFDGRSLPSKIESYVIKYVKVINDGYGEEPNWREMGMGDPSLMSLIIREIQENKEEIRKRLRP